MSVCIPGTYVTAIPTATGKLASGGDMLSVGVFRLPTDPLFSATLTLNNVVVGSRYRITRNDTGAELATGVASAADVAITGVGCFANPMQVDITVRNASGSPSYKIFDTSTFLVKAGASAYILQQPDE